MKKFYLIGSCGYVRRCCISFDFIQFTTDLKKALTFSYDDAQFIIKSMSNCHCLSLKECDK